MNLARNREFVGQLSLFIVVAAVFAGAAGMFAGFRTALWVGAAGITACILFTAVSHRRYNEIARLSAQIDKILHDSRHMDFSDYREGDIAILKNEMNKMVSALRQTTENLQAEREALANALADVSHQIRTPLTAMGLLLVSLERAQTQKERARLLHELEVLIDRVGWLVTTLLKLAKADAGTIRVQHERVTVSRVVQDALLPLAAALDLRGVSCVVDVDEGAAFTGDAAWTTEALENIIKNCMEHTPEQGSIRVQAREDALACRISICDGGAGIADCDLPHIFERFYRGKNSEGFGIGLALAQALIVAQDGSVRASNDKTTGGARFDITFPKVVI